MVAVKKFKLEGIAYPINTADSEFIPDSKNFIKGSLDKKILKSLMANINLNIPTLLTGPTGAGKTATVRWLASQTNNSYRRIQLNGSTNIDNFVGRYLINNDKGGTYWVDGILTEAMKKGHWLLLDEINAALPEILFVLNSILDDDKCLILDDKGTEIVKPHPDFRLFAAMNPSQDYAGTKEMNRAQLDRFIVLNYEYPTPENEELIIEKHSGIDRTLGVINDKGRPVVGRMVELANIIRQKNADTELISVCSTRQLIQWATLCEYLGIKHAAEITIINKCDAEEQKEITDELNKLFKNGESIQKHADAIKKDAIDKKATVKDVTDSININPEVTNTTIDPEVLRAQRIATQDVGSPIQGAKPLSVPSLDEGMSYAELKKGLQALQDALKNK